MVDRVLVPALLSQPLPEPRRAKKNGLARFQANPLICLAEWTGLEPATPGVTGRYSNQLNYHSRWLLHLCTSAIKLGVP